MTDEIFPITILNERSRWDLIDQLRDHSSVLQDLENDSLYNLLYNVPNNLNLGLGFRDPKILKAQFSSRGTSSSVVKKYAQMILSGVEFDPVFVSDDQFVDGGHRVEAYVSVNKDQIPVINVAPLYKIDWQEWLDNPEI